MKSNNIKNNRGSAEKAKKLMNKCYIDNWKIYSKGNLITVFIFNSLLAYLYAFGIYIYSLESVGYEEGLIEKVSAFGIFVFSIGIICCGLFYGLAHLCITIKLTNTTPKDASIQKLRRFIRVWIVVGCVIYAFVLIFINTFISAKFELDVGLASNLLAGIFIVLCQLKSIFAVSILNWKKYSKIVQR